MQHQGPDIRLEGLKILKELLLASPTMAPEAAEGNESPHMWSSYFSPIEKQIVQIIGREKVSGKAIGAKLHLLDASGQAVSRLKIILANLCERGILESEDGYSLTESGYHAADHFQLID